MQETVTLSIEQEFDETYSQYNQAFEDRDLERFMSFYRDDATKIDVGGDAQWNKREIAGLFGELFQMDFTGRFTPQKKVVDGSTALVILDSRLTSEYFDEHFLTSLTFTRDADGQWKVLVAASTNLVS